ncbi:hypothetical protein HanIR_Chr14g0704311 [Helianthus annuus]|nr:hypothetical protein HanIR_Chr14g0704311 [Helianthus annuus]
MLVYQKPQNNNKFIHIVFKKNNNNQKLFRTYKRDMYVCMYNVCICREKVT